MSNDPVWTVSANNYSKFRNGNGPHTVSWVRHKHGTSTENPRAKGQSPPVVPGLSLARVVTDPHFTTGIEWNVVVGVAFSTSNKQTEGI
ncbi:hypothetical protein F442_12205 [Phytophthora nicotianae P10297]|uniref:Uncharacterized protein n=1 Tax=Phytophthora nicotianae P10297 TaxID=1317064 RepID=W2YZJ5_PHYNI|nr:hypothetical protein F442_12205 [Phytophthora nicotianae P10297]